MRETAQYRALYKYNYLSEKFNAKMDKTKSFVDLYHTNEYNWLKIKSVTDYLLAFIIITHEWSFFALK